MIKYIFLAILLIFLYAVYIDERFLAKAALSPLLIIIGVWLHKYLPK